MSNEEPGILELQARMRAGELTARALCAQYLARIEALDVHGPALNSVIELNPDALEIAQALDDERERGKLRGPLHGIPVLLKDNIATADDMQTTAGSLALQGRRAARDAFLVKRLRAAGMVVLGKTNLSEWANFRGGRSISGWSSRGGLTRNPYALDRSASGSSSGSAVAVAANLCAVAVGTETDGSIISPAQTSGIVGIKPTLGLVSRSGIIPIAHSFDTAGPMARTVADAALLLGALTGVDVRDAASAGSTRHIHKDYTPFLDRDGLRGARIGVARDMAGNDARVLTIFERSLDVLRQQGAVLIDPIAVPNFNGLGGAQFEVMLYEFKAGLNAYLATPARRALHARGTVRSARSPIRTLADVIAFNEANAEQVMPYFGQELLLAAQAKGSLSSRLYRAALATCRRLSRREGIDVPMKQHQLSAIVFPSGGPAGLVDPVHGNTSSWRVHSTSAAAVAGYPHVTVPAGYIGGSPASLPASLPVGMSFVAKAWQEPTLIKLAYAFEQATRVRMPPTFPECSTQMRR